VVQLALVESVVAHDMTQNKNDQDDYQNHAWAPTEMINFGEIEFLSPFANKVAISPRFAAVATTTASNQEGNVYFYQLQDG